MKITVNLGLGRKQNPFSQFVLHGQQNEINPEWSDFERTVQPYPVFNSKGEPVKEFNGEAELVRQKKVENGAYCWIDISDLAYDNIRKASEQAGYKTWFTRQVFIITEPEKSSEPESGDETQFDKNRFYTKQLADCPFCGSKAGEELFMYRAEPDHYLVRCCFCTASMKHDRADKVIGIWNHRGLIKNRS